MQTFYDLSCSVVLYQNDREILGKCIESIMRSSLSLRLFLVDNSPTDALKDITSDPKVTYIFNNANLGFGKAHNIALRESEKISKYHLILNPDVYFNGGTLEALVSFMDENPEAGLVMPKVISFENEMQFLCKRLPSPLELIFRRFFPKLIHLIEDKMLRYEMRDKDYDSVFEAPSLSGCFMLLRTEAIRKIGYFDESFFMYMEDIDLSRRIYSHFKNLYYPYVSVYHGHAKESYRNPRLMHIHIRSAIKYFNKWGWFVDKEREFINNNV